MLNEENTQEVKLEEQDQTESTEEVQSENTQPEADDSKPQENVVTLSPAEYRHFKKWKKSQDEPQPKVVTPPQSVSPQNNVEETVLLANGMSDELLGELKAVARARGISSLIKAQADPIFVAVKEKLEAEKRQKAASLPASRGAGQPKVQKDFKSPGLSSEEHKRMFKEQFSS